MKGLTSLNFTKMKKVPFSLHEHIYLLSLQWKYNNYDNAIY